MNEENLIKKKYLPVVLAVCIIAFISFVIAGYYFFGPLERKITEARFSVADYQGFEGNRTAITFGTLTPGGAGQRKISFRNDYDFPVILKIRMSRTLKPYVSADIPEMLLPGQTYSIGMFIAVPNDMPFGEYSGKIVFEFWRK